MVSVHLAMRNVKDVRTKQINALSARIQGHTCLFFSTADAIFPVLITLCLIQIITHVIVPRNCLMFLLITFAIRVTLLVRLVQEQQVSIA